MRLLLVSFPSWDNVLRATICGFQKPTHATWHFAVFHRWRGLQGSSCLPQSNIRHDKYNVPELPQRLPVSFQQVHVIWVICPILVIHHSNPDLVEFRALQTWLFKSKASCRTDHGFSGWSLLHTRCQPKQAEFVKNSALYCGTYLSFHVHSFPFLCAAVTYRGSQQQPNEAHTDRLSRIGANKNPEIATVPEEHGQA